MTSTAAGPNIPPDLRIKYIVDATIGYPLGHVPTVAQVLSGEYQVVFDLKKGEWGTLLQAQFGNQLHVHYRIFPIGEVPVESEQLLGQWLMARWTEKDALLENFYR